MYISFLSLTSNFFLSWKNRGLNMALIIPHPQWQEFILHQRISIRLLVKIPTTFMSQDSVLITELEINLHLGFTYVPDMKTRSPAFISSSLIVCGSVSYMYAWFHGPITNPKSLARSRTTCLTRPQQSKNNLEWYSSAEKKKEKKTWQDCRMYLSAKLVKFSFL